MDLEIACKIACLIVIALGFFLLTAQIRGAQQEIRTTRNLVIDSIGLIRGEIAASSSLRSPPMISDPGRDKLQRLRITRPDPAAQVTIVDNSPAPSSQDGALVNVEFSPYPSYV